MRKSVEALAFLKLAGDDRRVTDGALQCQGVERGGFSEAKAHEVIALLGSVQKASGIRGLTRLTESVLRHDPTEPGCFLYVRHIVAEPQTAARLNGEFADKLVEGADRIHDPGLRFAPVFMGVRVDGGNT